MTNPIFTFTKPTDDQLDQLDNIFDILSVLDSRLYDLLDPTSDEFQWYRDQIAKIQCSISA